MADRAWRLAGAPPARSPPWPGRGSGRGRRPCPSGRSRRSLRIVCCCSGLVHRPPDLPPSSSLRRGPAERSGQRLTRTPINNAPISTINPSSSASSRRRRTHSTTTCRRRPLRTVGPDEPTANHGDVGRAAGPSGAVDRYPLKSAQPTAPDAVHCARIDHPGQPSRTRRSKAADRGQPALEWHPGRRNRRQPRGLSPAHLSPACPFIPPAHRTPVPAPPSSPLPTNEGTAPRPGGPAPGAGTGGGRRRRHANGSGALPATGGAGNPRLTGAGRGPSSATFRSLRRSEGCPRPAPGARTRFPAPPPARHPPRPHPPQTRRRRRPDRGGGAFERDYRFWRASIT